MDARAEVRQMLRRPALIAAAMVLGACAFAALAWVRYDQLAEVERSQMRQASEQRRQLAELRRQSQDAQASAPRYEQLIASGAVGTFDKTRALDSFEAIARAFPGQVLGYSLSGQASFDLDDAASLSQHVLYRHRLSFEMEPRHEETFLRLLNALARDLPGLASIEGCEMKRSGDDAGAGLKARCTMDWVSFGDRSARAGTGDGGPMVPAPAPALNARARP